MPRRPDLLDRIQVPTPCDADWDSMVGNDHVRFCNHCNLEVTNLSAMTRSEARRLVRESGGRLCVRYYRKPDGSLLTAPADRLYRIAGHASKVAAGAFGAVLTLSAGAVAQTGPQSSVAARKSAERVVRAPADGAGVDEGGGASLAGTIFDPNRAVIANASVMLTNKETGMERAVVTDGEGAYRFDSLPPGTYSLTAAASGFSNRETDNVKVEQGAAQKRDATLEVQGPREEVEVTAKVGEGETVNVSGGAVLALPTDPLTRAAFQDDLKAVKELLALGADVNVVDKDEDTTALEQAVEHGDAEMVLALLGAGADVNLRNDVGQTALMALSDETSADIVRALLGAGARVNLKDRDGDTALIHAAGRAKAEALQVLIEAGAKVNAKDNDGRAALLEAAGEGLAENVRALLIAGADIGVKDDDGKTALALAKEGEHEEAVALLVVFGAVE